MVATQQLLQTQDIPFSVQGYVTDPKMVGYQILTNYESTYWRALVGNDSWGLYEVLRSFCHEGNPTCYPSVNLLLNILGVTQRRVITGWATVVKGKEYRYPGLIEVLQENKLVVAEVQGEGPKMRYVFHVNMTPGLLTDAQLEQLPKILQKKHAELLERCEQALQEMEAKRRPPKVKLEAKNEPQNDDSGGMTNCQRGMTNCQRGYDKLSPEQHQYNNTQLTHDSVHVDHNNNSGGESDTQNHVVVALVDHGISQRVAQRLANRYSEDRVRQKVEYLEYLIEERPDKVQKPNGWLRRAIEEDYGAPDGYRSKEERERLAAEEEKRAEEEESQAAAAEERNKALLEQKEAEQAARVNALREEYGTTEADLALWEQAKTEIKYTAMPEINTLIPDLEMLNVRDGTVLLGAWTEAAWRRLQHPGTAKVVERALRQAAGRPVTIRCMQPTDVVTAD